MVVVVVDLLGGHISPLRMGINPGDRRRSSLTPHLAALHRSLRRTIIDKSINRFALQNSVISRRVSHRADLTLPERVNDTPMIHESTTGIVLREWPNTWVFSRFSRRDDRRTRTGSSFTQPSAVQIVPCTYRTRSSAGVRSRRSAHVTAGWRVRCGKDNSCPRSRE